MDKLEVLKQVFGHEGFREGQERLVDELLGGHDVLGVMPTGAGKSVCYQLPALMLEGVTLVISPLISLMKDQVMALKASGVAAAYINSSLTPGQQAEALRRAAAGAYRIIYVAPERLDTPSFLAFAQKARIPLLAVDEAHCVSQWGQDFRPSYLRIADFVRRLPRRPAVAAFTATATRRVREDIVRMLELEEPLCVTTGYNRPNLHFSCIKPSNKFTMLCSFLDTMPGECGIVYCNTRRTVQDVTEKLTRAGYSATRYHAGLTDAERHANQDDFQYDRARIMVATNAFGMGIDKSNVRFVVHYNMPRDLESYYQEAGRAGRDGGPAECLLLYSGQDVITGRWMIEHSEENPELTPAQREELTRRDLERLRQMTFYATSRRCLRHFILNYFGETDAQETCDNCSVCQGEPFEVDVGNGPKAWPELARDIAREERLARKGAPRGAEAALSAWERALLENLKTLRKLLAARTHAPAYTVFSDASLIDMVKKRPSTMESFLDVSGVGQAKQQKYGRVFLRVIRDGMEPNEALEQEADDGPGRLWTEEEEQALRGEFQRGETLEEMAQRHRRSTGGIRKRLRALGLGQ
ncbi:MAG: RecQ family ATP-dependent DNA helicase [Clostridiales bacterium]|nr:RecQ family ATP-dependent DNA helicase [Clostridiales bacterium]